ncbi:hypothetical protein QBC44DRAFT_375674 [Cladorrhinum sp. PSN332]|nr:hypothetical protein QBC44DRAFT_375674 [Cladorrhinum sp. PSN332]
MSRNYFNADNPHFHQNFNALNFSEEVDTSSASQDLHILGPSDEVGDRDINEYLIFNAEAGAADSGEEAADVDFKHELNHIEPGKGVGYGMENLNLNSLTLFPNSTGPSSQIGQPQTQAVRSNSNPSGGAKYANRQAMPNTATPQILSQTTHDFLTSTPSMPSTMTQTFGPSAEFHAPSLDRLPDFNQAIWTSGPSGLSVPGALLSTIKGAIVNRARYMYPAGRVAANIIPQSQVPCSPESTDRILGRHQSPDFDNNFWPGDEGYEAVDEEEDEGEGENQEKKQGEEWGKRPCSHCKSKKWPKAPGYATCVKYRAEWHAGQTDCEARVVCKRCCGAKENPIRKNCNECIETFRGWRKKKKKKKKKKGKGIAQPGEVQEDNTIPTTQVKRKGRAIDGASESSATRQPKRSKHSEQDPEDNRGPAQPGQGEAVKTKTWTF